jgi:hypothetical protein
VNDTAFGDGFEKGELAKALKVAKVLKDKSVSLDIIMASTGLSEAEIEKL